jgi:hypothetical protein
MPVFAAKDHLSDVIGLKNDIVFKVFTCPDCKTDVTISRWQTEGELPIVCARCNCRYSVKGEQILDANAERQYFIERWQDGKPTQTGIGYQVFMKLDAAQKAAPIPKDSFTLVMKPQLAAPKPAPKPAAAPGAAPATPPAPKPASEAPQA